MRIEDQEEPWEADAQAVAQDMAAQEFKRFKEALKARYAPKPPTLWSRVKNAAKRLLERLVRFGKPSG